MILQKLSSRKFVLSLVVMVAGLVTALGGPTLSEGQTTEIAALVVGLAAAVGAVVAYISGEAQVDRARIISGEFKGPGEGPGGLLPPDTPTTTPVDLVRLIQLIQKAHPDWDEFRVKVELKTLTGWLG